MSSDATVGEGVETAAERTPERVALRCGQDARDLCQGAAAAAAGHDEQ